MWKQILKIGTIEVWQTPSKFLVCKHYDGVFKFFENPKKAIDYAHSMRIEC